MSFARLQKVVTYLLAVLGLCALGFGGEVSLSVIAALAVGYALSWFAEGAVIARPLWARGITTVIVIALVFQVLRGLAGEGGWLGLAMEFSGLLSLSRLCNRRTAADYQQVAMLAFVQLIAATVLTTDLSYAGLFVAFVVVTPWVLTFAHLRHEIERNYPVEQSSEGGVDLARVLSSRRIVDPSFLLWTALLSVPMLCMTVTLFVLFPRIGLGMLSFGQNRAQHTTGFGTNIELGGFGVIRDDPTIVMRVSLSRPLSSIERHRVLRLRGTAFDQYDGRTWTRSSGEAVKMAPIGEYYPIKRLPRDDDITLRVILDQLDEPVLFVPTGTVGLKINERGLPGSPRERISLTRSHGLDLRYGAGDELGIVYEASVSLRKGESDVPADRELDEARYLALPGGHERVVALARKLTEGLDDPMQKARRLEHYLSMENYFRYSLELPDTKGKVPLDAFLFDAKSGHCEYFSSALAIMLRAVGIPSRNVTGYVGGEYNTYGGYYGVRQADAHSWVEALMPGRGWVLLEPTPAARAGIGPSQLFRDLRAILDAMRAYWITKVVGYDLRSQLRALRDLRSFFRGLRWGDGQEASGRPEEKGIAKKRIDSTLAVGAVVVVALGFAGIALVTRLRRAKRKNGLRDSARKAQKLYLELEQVLRRRGVPRAPNVTPEAHARELRASGFVGAEAVTRLTDAYLETRYGTRALSVEELRKLRAELRDVKRAA